MRLRVWIVVFGVALIGLAAACGGGSGGASTTSAADRAIQKAVHTSLNEMSSLGDPNVEEIKAISVSDGDVEIKTDIYGDDEGHAAGYDLCNLVSTALVKGVKSIEVNGQGGDPLAYSSGTVGATDQLSCSKT
jgi:hypothetical protein